MVSQRSAQLDGVEVGSMRVRRRRFQKNQLNSPPAKKGGKAIQCSAATKSYLTVSLIHLKSKSGNRISLDKFTQVKKSC